MERVLVHIFVKGRIECGKSWQRKGRVERLTEKEVG